MYPPDRFAADIHDAVDDWDTAKTAGRYDAECRAAATVADLALGAAERLDNLLTLLASLTATGIDTVPVAAVLAALTPKESL